MKTLIFNIDGTLNRVVADSALAFNRRPWFVPDFSTEWRASFGLAVRVSRLGKGVAERFASRYYDAYTVAMLPTCATPLPLLTYMDGAVVLGDWIVSDSVPTSVTASEHTVMAPEPAVIDRALATATLSATLKTGDIIIIPLEIPEFIP
ncbi:MAG: hypothetical protein K2M76_07030, partial [Muribaculaceae bacterium]|nr:hypothetical protein [Muribaculaceae bacterium]